MNDEQEWSDATSIECNGCKKSIAEGNRRKLRFLMCGKKIKFEIFSVKDLPLCDECMDDLRGSTTVLIEVDKK